VKSVKRELLKFFNSPRFSLACAGVNGFFALNSFVDGNITWGIVCTVFAGFCFNNYISGIKRER
jgi:hypothetical protein